MKRASRAQAAGKQTPSRKLAAATSDQQVGARFSEHTPRPSYSLARLSEKSEARTTERSGIATTRATETSGPTSGTIAGVAAKKEPDAHARLNQLVILLRTLEREWRGAKPDFEGAGVSIGDYVKWDGVRTLLETAVAKATHTPGATPSGVSGHDAKFVNETAKTATVVAAQILDGAREPIIHVVDGRAILEAPEIGSTVAVILYALFALMPEIYPPEETRARIADAVREELAAFDDRHTSWTSEDKARKIVRTGLKVLGWTKDPFVGPRVAAHRARTRR